MAELSARAVLITGAASGIGRATAFRLSSEYQQLILVDVDRAGLEQTSSTLPSRCEVTTAVLDLAECSTLSHAVNGLLADRFVDALVNVAGIGYAASTAETTLEQWDKTLAVDLTSVFLLCKAVLPPMIAKRKGTIVNVASAGGIVGLRRRAAYCAAKAGVIGLTRAMAADHAEHGIRVNAIAPGTVDSEWIGKILSTESDPAAVRRRMEQRQLDGRMGTPEEVAEGIAFLVSDQARFVNGSVFVMDGGLTAV
jgi:NAD(P)-dependent dehydrogenase (short-subunit alcohol dehydrogenase family)